MRGRGTLFLKIGLSALVMGYLLRQISLEAMLASARSFSAATLALYIGLTLFLQVPGALAFQLQLKEIRPVPFRRILGTYVFSTFLGGFTPAQLGELALAYELKKDGIPLQTGVSVYFLNKVISLLISFVLALVGLQLYFHAPSQLWIACAALGAGAAYPLFFTNWIRHMPEKYREFFAYLHTALQRTPGTLVQVTLLLVLRYLLQVASMLVLFRALEPQTPFAGVLILFSMARFVTLIPFVLDVGMLELSAVYLFRKVGVPDAATFNAYMGSRLLNYAIGAILIALFFALKRAKAAQVPA